MSLPPLYILFLFCQINSVGPLHESKKVKYKSVIINIFYKQMVNHNLLLYLSICDRSISFSPTTLSYCEVRSSKRFFKSRYISTGTYLGDVASSSIEIGVTFLRLSDSGCSGT
jgi:hypothetical protein